MALRNTNQVDQAQDGNIVLIEETLSDNSKAYEIRIYADPDTYPEDCLAYQTIQCINQDAANDLFTMLANQSDYFINN